MNRAVHGDVIAVEVLPESEWRAPTDEVVDQESAPISFWPVARLVLKSNSDT